MRRYTIQLLCTLFALLATSVATAQKIAIAERVPKAEIESWLHEFIPARHDYSCMFFVHSASIPCVESLLHFRTIAADKSAKMRVVVITKEAETDISGVLPKLLDEGYGVAFDKQGATFRSFGVRYTPFCVITDRKRRAVWFGNPQQLSAEQLDELLK